VIDTIADWLKSRLVGLPEKWFSVDSTCPVYTVNQALAPSGGSLFLIISELPPTSPEQSEELE
jgi:hypothetical protein